MSQLFFETYRLPIAIHDQEYQVLKPLRSGEWLHEPALVAPDDSPTAPMATSLLEVDGSSVLAYHWHTADTVVTLRVEGYNVTGRHPHHPFYIVEEPEDYDGGAHPADNGTAQVSTRPYKHNPSRSPVYRQAKTGLSAEVASVNALRRRAIALLHGTPANKVY